MSLQRRLIGSAVKIEVHIGPLTDRFRQLCRTRNRHHHRARLDCYNAHADSVASLNSDAQLLRQESERPWLSSVRRNTTPEVMESPQPSRPVQESRGTLARSCTYVDESDEFFSRSLLRFSVADGNSSGTVNSSR